MKQHPRDPNLAPKAAAPPREEEISDLVDLKAIAASTRANATAPVVSAAALSGVVARRDSVVGARVADGSSGIPPWFWGVIGCLGVMALGLGVFWYLDAAARRPSLAAIPARVPARPPPRWPVMVAPEIVPIPPPPSSGVEPQWPEKGKSD